MLLKILLIEFMILSHNLSIEVGSPPRDFPDNYHNDYNYKIWLYIIIRFYIILGRIGIMCVLSPSEAWKKWSLSGLMNLWTVYYGQLFVTRVKNLVYNILYIHVYFYYIFWSYGFVIYVYLIALDKTSEAYF